MERHLHGRDGRPLKGRGATANPAPRYEAVRVEAPEAPDGWALDPDPDGGLDQGPGRLRTVLGVDTSRTVITRNRSPDVPFDRSINPYRGCEHGCVYCFARPTHAYLGLSPGLDFEARIFHKPRAPELLERELARPGYRCAPLALGINTDAYQPVERHLGLTRRILEVLSAWNHPVTLVTKSALVERDLDLLADMARRRLVHVAFSVTTLDRELARTLEPRATAPGRRLEALARLAGAGVPVGVMVAPLIPALTDGELEAILTRAREAGAAFAGYVLLRLPHEVKGLFQGWLETHRPLQASRVMALLRACRGGRDYEARFGARMEGTGPYAALLRRRFELTARRLGYRAPPPLEASRFGPPRASGKQLELFDPATEG